MELVILLYECLFYVHFYLIPIYDVTNIKQIFFLGHTADKSHQERVKQNI